MDDKLDAVLRCLNDHYDKKHTYTEHTLEDGRTFVMYKDHLVKITGLSFEEIQKETETILKEIPVELALIIPFLLKKEFILFIKDMTGTKYAITLEGKRFIIDGGFSEQTKKMKKEAQNEIARTRWLTVGTWLAGIGAIGLVLLEIYKHYYWTQPCH